MGRFGQNVVPFSQLKMAETVGKGIQLNSTHVIFSPVMGCHLYTHKKGCSTIWRKKREELKVHLVFLRMCPITNNVSIKLIHVLISFNLGTFGVVCKATLAKTSTIDDQLVAVKMAQSMLKIMHCAPVPVHYNYVKTLYFSHRIIIQARATFIAKWESFDEGIWSSSHCGSLGSVFWHSWWLPIPHHTFYGQWKYQKLLERQACAPNKLCPSSESKKLIT